MNKTKNIPFYLLGVESENTNLVDCFRDVSGRTINKEAKFMIEQVKRKLREFKSVQVIKIDENLEVSAPKTFKKERLKALAGDLNGFTVVAPLSFDRIALLHAFEKENINAKNITWISGSRIIRRIEALSENKAKYQNYRSNAYNIGELAKLAGVEFPESSTCEVFAKLLRDMLVSENTSLENLWNRVRSCKQFKSASPNVERRGAPNCPFSGISLKISGKISESVNKLDGAHWAAGLGFKVVNNNEWVNVYVRGDSTNSDYNQPGYERGKDEKYDYLINSKQFLDLVASEFKYYEKKQDSSSAA